MSATFAAVQAGDSVQGALDSFFAGTGDGQPAAVLTEVER